MNKDIKDNNKEIEQLENDLQVFSLDGDNNKTGGSNHYSDILKRAGLNQNEARVYDLLLNRGQTSILELNKALPEITRTNLYNILYSLRDEGVVEQTIKGKKINFKPADPHKLRDLLSQRRQKIIESEAVIEGVLPQMLSLYNLTTNKPSVRYYEGTQGVELVYKELNNSNAKELLLIRSIYDDDHPELKKLVEKQILKQVNLGIKTKALTPLVAESKLTFKEYDAKRLVTRRIVERERLILSAQILIWGNVVAISSMKGKLISTVIENKSISDTFKTIFEFIWDSSLSYHQKIIKLWKTAPSDQDNL